MLCFLGVAFGLKFWTKIPPSNVISIQNHINFYRQNKMVRNEEINKRTLINKPYKAVSIETMSTETVPIETVSLL